MATPDTGYTLLPAERRESLGGAALHEENEMSEVFHDEWCLFCYSYPLSFSSSLRPSTILNWFCFWVFHSPACACVCILFIPPLLCGFMTFVSLFLFCPAFFKQQQWLNPFIYKRRSFILVPNARRLQRARRTSFFLLLKVAHNGSDRRSVCNRQEAGTYQYGKEWVSYFFCGYTLNNVQVMCMADFPHLGL